MIMQPMARLIEFPPHARGWTRLLNPVLSDVQVSPARAGMDP